MRQTGGRMNAVYFLCPELACLRKKPVTEWSLIPCSELSSTETHTNTCCSPVSVLLCYIFTLSDMMFLQAKISGLSVGSPTHRLSQNPTCCLRPHPQNDCAPERRHAKEHKVHLLHTACMLCHRTQRHIRRLRDWVAIHTRADRRKCHRLQAVAVRKL
jgi:hypothetical protein